jgi:hypothetical protein
MYIYISNVIDINIIIYIIYNYNIKKYIKKLLGIPSYILKRADCFNLCYNFLRMYSQRNSIINEVNWNILVTLGKEIKRDSMISENESREAYVLLESIYCYK